MTASARKDFAAGFWDRIADRYARTPVPNEDAYQEKLRITREYLRPGMQVLELGCGTGSTALAHAPHVDSILATDISERMLGIAREKAAAATVENVEFRQTSVEEFDAPAGSFDVIMGHSLLHLLEDRDKAIARIHELLKPGGVFVSSTACLGDWLRIFKLIGPIGRWLRLLPTIRVFREAELVESLTDAGFAIERRWNPGKRQAIFIVARKSV